jgi:hypothetical protein
MTNNWIFRIWFSDGKSVEERCHDEEECVDKEKLAMKHGYLIEKDKHFTMYPSQSIVKFEYHEEG